MIEAGLLSITFRTLPAARVIALAVEAGLSSIEWGGDIHVPPGDTATSKEVARQTADAGLRVSAYGSYYRAATPGGPPFEAVLASASALDAKTIRVWAGDAGSAGATAEHRKAVAADIGRCCDLIAARGIAIAMEFHGNTLSDEVDSALSLIDAVARPNFGTFWQPPVGMSPEHALVGLRRVLPHLLNLHVFHWWPDANTRLPLADGAERWKDYLQVAATSPHARYASLEFVAGDDIEQFRRDAVVLRSLLSITQATTSSDRVSS